MTSFKNYFRIISDQNLRYPFKVVIKGTNLQKNMEQKYTTEEIERLMESIDRRLDFILKALDKEEEEKQNG